MQLKWGKPRYESMYGYAHGPKIWAVSVRERADLFEEWLHKIYVDPACDAGDIHWHKFEYIKYALHQYFYDREYDHPPVAALREGLDAIGVVKKRARFEGWHSHMRYGPLVLAV